MEDRRKNSSRAAIAAKDAGLFKLSINQLEIHLLARFWTNGRNDVIFDALLPGSVDAERSVEAVFAGRRQTEATWICERIKTMLKQRAKEAAALGQDVHLDADLFSGSWRSRYVKDDCGWQSRTHQFMAAQWSMPDIHGQPQFRGEPPQT